MHGDRHLLYRPECLALTAISQPVVVLRCIGTTVARSEVSRQALIWPAESTSVARSRRRRETSRVKVTQRLARLDENVLQRWPSLEAKSPAASLRLIIIYQAIAVAEIFAGLGTGNALVTGLAVAPLVLGIGAAWRLLYPAGDRAH